MDQTIDTAERESTRGKRFDAKTRDRPPKCSALPSLLWPRHQSGPFSAVWQPQGQRYQSSLSDLRIQPLLVCKVDRLKVQHKSREQPIGSKVRA